MAPRHLLVDELIQNATFTENNLQIIIFLFTILWETRWRNWLRHCATSRKVAGSIADGVIGIFH